ncbi:sigma-70 family RNA polymerase sigma factor [Stenotrophomonas tumulicola]
MHGWLRRRVGSSTDAADLVQDTFLAVVSGGGAQDIRAPRSFLATVAGRILIRRRQRWKLEQSYLEQLAAAPAEHAPSAEAQLLALETLRALDAALEGLPCKARQAFLMAHLELMSYSEIARRLGVSSSSVKQYLTRANRQCLFLMAC